MALGRWHQTALRIGCYLPLRPDRKHGNRHLSAMDELLLALFHRLSKFFNLLNTDFIYVIDRFPVAAGDNLYLPPSRCYPDETYRNHLAS